jgi:hypothetical protein
MAMKTCPDCSGEMSESASACPKCGWKPKKTKWWLWVPVGAVGAFFLFGFIASNQPGAKEKSQARSAIDLCHKERDRMIGDPGAHALAAGTCTMMEDRFAEKYGHRP